jgi:tRNA A58 N-methylase Trm61
VHKIVSSLPSPPVWGIFPILRFGRLFFNTPPGHSRTCSNQFFHSPRTAGRELRYPKAGYCADGQFIEELRNEFPYACVHSSHPLAVVDQSNRGSRLSFDRGFLEGAFADYVTNYSIETEAISLAASYFLLELLDSIAPRRVLDLGCGWTSFLFRWYKRHFSPDLVVWSVDQSEHWLGITAKFLAKHDLDTAELHLWPRISGELFDFVFYDLGRPWERQNHLAQVLSCTQGTLVCDDLHYENYRTRSSNLRSHMPSV